jgi:hypothetical protein
MGIHSKGHASASPNAHEPLFRLKLSATEVNPEQRRASVLAATGASLRFRGAAPHACSQPARRSNLGSNDNDAAFPMLQHADLHREALSLETAKPRWTGNATPLEDLRFNHSRQNGE